MVRLQPDAAEEAGEYGFAAGDVARAGLRQVVGDDAQQHAQVEDVPAVPAQDAQRRSLHRIAFARDGFDERRFARAVRAEDGDVLALGDGEGEGVERALLAAHDGDVVELQERVGQNR